MILKIMAMMMALMMSVILKMVGIMVACSDDGGDDGGDDTEDELIGKATAFSSSILVKILIISFCHHGSNMIIIIQFIDKIISFNYLKHSKSLIMVRILPIM